MREDIYKVIKNRQQKEYVFPSPHPAVLVDECIRNRKNHPFIIYRDLDGDRRDEITYAEFGDMVGRTANFLHSCGLKKGDRFCYCMRNRPESLVFLFAAMKSGIAVVPLDILKDPVERKLFKIKHSSARLLITSDEYESESRQADELKTISGEIPELRILGTGQKHPARVEDFHECLSRAPDEYSGKDALSDNDEVLLLYTSGTTAFPKGVVQTPRSLMANAQGICEWLKITRDDRFNIILPLHHINSTVFSLSTFIAGGTIILNSRYSHTRFWDVIASERATLTSIVPTIMEDLLSSKDRFAHDVRTLTRIQIGSAPVNPSSALEFYRHFGIRLVQGYGSTEVNLRATGVPMDLNEEEYLQVLGENSIGVELLNNNVMIEGAVKEGDEGEILIRGPVITKGYLNDSAANDEAFSGGWFHSGDIGTFRDIGGKRYYFIRGRKKEIIIKGGVNISPLHVEHVILSQVPEIERAYAVGMPDKRVQEEVCLAAVFKHGISEEEAREKADQLCVLGLQGKIRGLSPFEAPRRILPFKLAKLPMTSTGKVQRVELRSMISALLQNEPPAKL